METLWKWMNLILGFFLVGFCKGYPIPTYLEDTSSSGHTQFLMGIAAILVAVGTIILTGCLCCRRQKGFQEFRNNPAVISPVASTDHGHVNPISNGEFTIFTPLQQLNLNNDLFVGSGEGIRGTSQDLVYGDLDVRKWYESNASDFPRVKLKYIRELGNGRFGKVVEGAAQNLEPNRAWSPVVVKILDATSSPRNRVLFLNDALFYLAPEHPNILVLKGRCLENTPLLIIHESCTGGDLKSRLRAFGSQDFLTLQWCCQLTSAVRHLHDNGFIHPDLASRNCLLTEDLTLKLGDYGLSASKYPEDYYKGGEPLIPVRWRSPESLDCTPTTIQPRALTKEANVWSLGVVMWEICENGAQPYEGLDDDEVVSRVFGPENLRLKGPSKPQRYSDYLFRLMRMCWNTAESRPNVSQIDLMLSDLLQVHKNTQDSLQDVIVSDFDQRWESFKPNTIARTDNQSDDSVSKPLSPSLNNLQGSLDNLLSLDPHVQFKLGFLHSNKDEKSESACGQIDSLTDSLIFKQGGSSESDTEEENWRRKVERGAYSEKVRLKSRSVADLMVLTHVDYSESESETPMPSLDYRLNRSVKNRSNLAPNFSSEGNLLSIENDFQKELKKLQVDRRDSLLFVPDDGKSENDSNLNLLHELNDPLEMKPINQIFNVFNVTIDKFDHAQKLQNLINIGDENRTFSRQDSENKSDLGYATLHNSERNSDFGSVDGEDSHAITESKLKNCGHQQQLKRNLPDILASLEESGDYAKVNVDLLESNRCDFSSSDERHEVPKLSDLVLNNYDIPNSLITNESHNVPDLYSENVESSDSVNSVLSKRLVEVSKSDVLVPEIKQNFIKGASIMESLRLSPDDKNKKICVSSLRSLDTQEGDVQCTYLEMYKFIDEEKSNVFVAVKLEENSEAGDSNIIVDEIEQNNQLTNQEMYYSLSQSEPTESGELEATQDSNPEQTVVLCEGPKNEDTKVAIPVSDEESSIAEISENNFNENKDGSCLKTILLEDDWPLSTNKPKVEFDLSPSQQGINPNPLTHTVHFATSTPMGMPSNNTLHSLPRANLFNKSPDQPDRFSSNFMPDSNVDEKLNYSLETWDTFLGKSFDSNIEDDENFFDSFTSEPQSMVFLDQDKLRNTYSDVNKPLLLPTGGDTLVKAQEEVCVQDGTFVIETKSDKLEEPNNKTFEVVNTTFDAETGDVEQQKSKIDDPTAKRWKSGEGWFLHPQSNNDDASSSEEIETRPDSYIRFGMDDEIMTAIRNELLEKLPQAQGAGQENLTEAESWTETERGEVFLRYNVYNMPLSPIAEESSFDEENEDIMVTSVRETDSDWSDQCQPDIPPILSTTVTIKSDNVANTPSQGSCCSSDTLFDFEDLVDKEINQDQRCKEDCDVKDVMDETNTKSTLAVSSDETSLETFLNNERSHSTACSLQPSPSKTVAPLPSPEDKPWKSLPASLLSYDSMQKSNLTPSGEEPSASTTQSDCGISSKTASDDDDDIITNIYENVPVDVTARPSEDHQANEMLGILTDIRFCGPIDSQLMSTSFSDSNDVEEQGWDSGSDTRSSSSGEFIWKEGEHEESLKALNAAPHDLLEDVQPMDGIAEEITESDISTTSSDEEGDNLEFVPSAWDKFATPTKSALRSPDKTLERPESKKPKGVWFKKQKYHCVYEYPKEPDSPVLQSQDLWKPQLDYASFTDWEFDVDAYLPPPTAESDLNPSTFTFKPKINNSRRSLYYLTTSINDLQGDGSSSSANYENDFISSPSSENNVDTNLLCSQFFPGASTWIDNITPDSGLEDTTPVSFPNKGFSLIEVMPLRKLAAQVLNRIQDEPVTSNGSKDVLGGLRHTRNTLKLDLPPSPSAFTSTKTFTVEPQPEPVVLREKPTFSTFGKSRFLVQHVDTPPANDDTRENTKNVCFDVLPYRPLNVLTEALKCEATKRDSFCKGEANLLDSADEDSGIESSTLERKSTGLSHKDNVELE